MWIVNFDIFYVYFGNNFFIILNEGFNYIVGISLLIWVV